MHVTAAEKAWTEILEPNFKGRFGKNLLANMNKKNDFPNHWLIS